MYKTSLSRVSFLFTAAVLSIALSTTHALADGLGNPKQFTVEMKMTVTSGSDAGEAMTMKYFVGENRLRMEVNMDGGQEGGIQISLHDGDQVTSYMLIPQMKMYMKSVSGEGGMMDEDEGPTLEFGSPDDADHSCNSDPEVTCKKLGSDTIIGRPVDKYRVTVVEDGTPYQSTIWFDRELLFPVRVEDNEGFMEALSIEVGKQPDELFEIPSGYREMSM